MGRAVQMVLRDQEKWVAGITAAADANLALDEAETADRQARDLDRAIAGRGSDILALIER